MSELGYWREPLTNLNADTELVWKAPGRVGLRVWVGLLGGQPVARISRLPGHGSHCSAAISGWMWTEQESGSLAARMGLKESPTRGFTTVPGAKRAIKAAIAAAKRAKRAHCIGCGCHDDAACLDEATGFPCSWLAVDRSAGLGVCSACPDELARWDSGDRTVAVPVEISPNDCDYKLLNQALALTGVISSTANGRERLKTLVSRLQADGLQKLVLQYGFRERDGHKLESEITHAMTLLERDPYAGMSSKIWP